MVQNIRSTLYNSISEAPELKYNAYDNNVNPARRPGLPVIPHISLSGFSEQVITGMCVTGKLIELIGNDFDCNTDGSIIWTYVRLIVKLPFSNKTGN